MKKLEIICTMIALIILCGLMILIGYNNVTTSKTNEKLKKEKYELSQQLEKEKEARLKCLVGIGE